MQLDLTFALSSVEAAQEADLAKAQSFAKPGVVVDRCRHASVKETALWVFCDGAQVASITRLLPSVWRVQRMTGGMPISNASAETIMEAMREAQTHV